jgi:hypothetical protein
MDPAHPLENWRAESALFLLGRKGVPAAERQAGGDLFG